MHKFILLFFSFLLFFVVLFPAFAPEPENVPTAAEQYTEKELQNWSGALLQNIKNVTETDDKEKAVCFQKLLGYKGETTYYFDHQNIISRVSFTFPKDTPWNEAANRISEQLGEPSFTALYDNGAAAAEWKNTETLYALSSEGKRMTLTAAKYYRSEN